MSNPFVSIFDDDGRRRESIAKVLRSLPQPSHSTFEVFEHDGQNWAGKRPSGGCCLLLVHWRNRGVLAGELKLELQPGTRIVPYSGGGLRAEDVNEDQTVVELGETCFISPIWGSVDSGESLSEEKWTGLVLHAIDRKPAVPDFLQVRPVLEIVPALSLLCQGYLAEYALKNQIDGTVSTKGFVDVGKALKAMGWVDDELAEKVSQTVDNLNFDSEKQTPNVAFWTEPFEGSKLLREGIRCELPKSLTKLPDDIENLFKAIDERMVSDEDFVDTVAKAYLTLSKLLEAA
ncbi:MAG: hypothetical protein KF752_09725 [Pirellulaceae bacterium]|nr:hypothetical protein [Pirellulaceae bacterium]